MNGQSIGEHNRLVRPRIRHKPTKPKPVATPLYTFYSIKSLDDLQNKHPDKLNNTSNIFHFKDTKSSLYYSKKDHQWVELKLANPDDPVQKFPLEYWIPASYCLDSTSGSGGTASRAITVLYEVAVENYMDIYAGLPTFAIHEAAGLSLGVKIGKQVAVTLFFSCAVNEGEVIQLQYRPSYVIVPEMEAVLYKFTGKSLKKKKVKKIKPFKTLIIDAPEHQCWATRNINDLQCHRPINHRHVIRF
ncbi:MAG: hypothetical protein M5F18_12655 [Asgard group archaeon]|nr:hypothetical protein [Asgard group archaeon]